MDVTLLGGPPAEVDIEHTPPRWLYTADQSVCVANIQRHIELKKGNHRRTLDKGRPRHLSLDHLRPEHALDGANPGHHIPDHIRHENAVSSDASMHAMQIFREITFVSSIVSDIHLMATYQCID